MEPFASRPSRFLAAILIFPIFLVSFLWGVDYLLAGFSKIRFGSLITLLGSLGTGGLAMGLAVVCFVKTRDILIGRSPPWSNVTRWAIGADVLMALLALVAIPKVNDLRRYSAEGASKGQLGLLRQAILEVQKSKGQFPLTVSDLSTAIPELKLFGTPHAPSRVVRYASLKEVSDSGQWLYDNGPGDSGFGTVIIDCSHHDNRDNPWSSY